MFGSAELSHEIDRKTYAREMPKLREALLDAQFDLAESKSFQVIILIGGVDGAGGDCRIREGSGQVPTRGRPALHEAARIDVVELVRVGGRARIGNAQARLVDVASRERILLHLRARDGVFLDLRVGDGVLLQLLRTDTFFGSVMAAQPVPPMATTSATKLTTIAGEGR